MAPSRIGCEYTPAPRSRNACAPAHYDVLLFVTMDYRAGLAGFSRDGHADHT